MKVTLLLGMLAWAVRYVLFALAMQATSRYFCLPASPCTVPARFLLRRRADLHRFAGRRGYRSSAQGLITLATYGSGC